MVPLAFCIADGDIWAGEVQDGCHCLTAISAYSFMIFNLLCAPCFAAMGAIKREMNNGKWTAIAIGYVPADCCLHLWLFAGQTALITSRVDLNVFCVVSLIIVYRAGLFNIFRP